MNIKLISIILTATNNNAKINHGGGGVIHVIMARGFSWNVKQSDIAKFFQNIHILGGSSAIVITKNNAMEATFAVNTSEDLQKALARDKHRCDLRTIHGKIYNISLISFDPKHFILTNSFFPLVSRIKSCPGGATIFHE